jgi:hypothetical protein
VTVLQLDAFPNRLIQVRIAGGQNAQSMSVDAPRKAFVTIDGGHFAVFMNPSGRLLRPHDGHRTHP